MDDPPSNDTGGLPLLDGAAQSRANARSRRNEDHWGLFPGLGLCVVVDGMGGLARGDVAAQIVTDTMAELIGAADPSTMIPSERRVDDEMRLRTAFKVANLRILERSRGDPSCRGMGACAVAALASHAGVVIAHVGTCRCYRVRDGAIERLTEDHSLLNEFLKMKRISPEEAADFPHPHVIVRALGMKETVDVDLRFDASPHGAIYLLCSDGVHDVLSDRQMLDVVVSAPDLPTAALRLVDEALAHGGADDITVAFFRWRAPAERPGR